MTNTPYLFCFGLGYTAHILANNLTLQGWKIEGTHQDSFFSRKLSPEITHLLISIPPDQEGDIVLQYYKEQIQQLPALKWVGYLSTTGVYGDTKGEWVDETSVVNPPNDRLKNRVLAENQWLALGNEVPVHIFRLAGIYGKGRSALENLLAGNARRIDKKDQYFSRIHVEDIVQVLIQSMAHPSPSAIYNVADDEPCSQEEVVRFAAELLGVEPPPLVAFQEAELSPMARSFYSSSRRVKNNKIKQELGVNLYFPHYRAGLVALKNNFYKEYIS